MPPEVTSLKQQLHSACEAVVSARIQNIQTELALTQASANEETKSSSGDKYETGRSMAQLEIEKATQQLRDAEHTLRTLLSVPLHTTPVAANGSVVITDLHRYYIAIAAGRIQVGGHTYFAVSPASPAGLALMGHRIGDTITIANLKMVIQEIL